MLSQRQNELVGRRRHVSEDTQKYLTEVGFEWVAWI
jgi:hypothetical protein